MAECCDLVMKGGITSGVIYPRLISELSKHYRFRNIGGTSAGAIAAGACAAAQYGRSHGNEYAFDRLDKLPQELGEKVTSEGRTRLFTLFLPTKSVRGHFAVFVRALNAAPRDAARAVLWEIGKLHALLVLASLLLGSLLLWPALESLSPGRSPGRLAVEGAAAMGLTMLTVALVTRFATRGQSARAIMAVVVLLGALALGLRWLAPTLAWFNAVLVALTLQLICSLVLLPTVALVAWHFLRSLLKGLHANGYGLCSGLGDDETPNDQPALTDWLTGYFNELAGKFRDGPPLRFGDLWGHDDPDEPREINLEVMTSAVSQQMVYGLPFRQGTPRFFYDPEEWSRLFPASVMKALSDSLECFPTGDSKEACAPGTLVQGLEGQALRPLPRRADLPVVVAVRMSLSFPVLLSAIPLYSIDWSLQANAEARKAIDKAETHEERAAHPLQAKRVWFSDGGIGSNMPLHMFDSLLPGHPTFAVNLKAAHPDHPIQDGVAGNEGGRIYLPTSNRGGHLRFWNTPNDSVPLGGLVGFLGSIIGTMQNWRDEIQFPYPGFRDRIVQISQRADEGGLNLDMPPENIAALSCAGALAAKRLIDRFHPDGADQGAGWRNHKAVRLGTFMGTLQPGSAALCPSLASGAWSTLVNDIRYDGPQRELAGNFLEVLHELAKLGPKSGTSLESAALRPLAQIRITPRI